MCITPDNIITEDFSKFFVLPRITCEAIASCIFKDLEQLVGCKQC